MNFIQQIAEINNLYWAWEKAKNTFQPGDVWFDEIEVASFEAMLHEELLAIQNDFLEGTYKMRPIRPVAYPKGADEEGPRTRQTFWISVRDQVAWIAVVNVIGRELDAEMPFWSYGNRLYVSAFYDTNGVTKKRELKFGYYRNTTRNIFRKWNQSWPMYRRHINLTSKFLSGKGKPDIEKEPLDEKEDELIEANDKLDKDHPLKVKYIQSDYWDEELTGDLFWAGLDLKNFYPDLNLDLIENNIAENLVGIDDNLKALIAVLLDFKIDFAGWTKPELKLIKLEENESYRHLPTGLFVAGFLANVAFLGIDKAIHKKLLAKKNLAHFRFVDDHVLLSSSFEELVKWIEEYEQLVKDSGIGASFNMTKTQPKKLSELLVNRIEGEKNHDLYSAAQTESQLDPDFPSPLMTQTLAKVSKIAGTEFQLLDPSAEKTLLEDIEHLLVTEFPDHELRRDTRISFAARMLSRLVPMMTHENETGYQLEKKLADVKLNQQKTIIELRRNGVKVEANALVEIELLGLEGVEENEVKRRQKVNSIISAYNQAVKERNELMPKIVAEYKKVEKEESKIVKRATKLLLKAIAENHEKVRLWARLLEFGLLSGHSDLEAVFKQIEHLKEKQKTCELSVTFIHSLLLQVLSQLMFKALAILLSTTSSQKKKTRSIKFLKDVFSEKIFDYINEQCGNSEKYYVSVSKKLFDFSAGSCIYLIKEHSEYDFPNLIEKYGLVNWEDDRLAFFENVYIAKNAWYWWVLNHLPKRSRESMPYLWERISNDLQVGQSIDDKIVQLYPRFLSQNILELMDENPKAYLPNEGWLFDAYELAIRNGRNVEGLGIFEGIRQKSSNLPEAISLYDWIQWIRVKQIESMAVTNSQQKYDPRLSEWMALEVLKQVCYTVQAKVKNVSFEIFIKSSVDYSSAIHPNNFLIPKKWQDETITTWENLRTQIEKSKIEMRDETQLIFDKRFNPAEGARSSGFSSNDENNKLISALGALFVCIITGYPDLPARWNPIGHQPSWLGLAISLLRTVPVSSETFDMIEGCFSKRNWETQLLKQMVIQKGMLPENDTKKDPPYFINIESLIKYIRESMQILRDQQLSVSNHQPRQLIPIRLHQLKRQAHQEQVEE